MRVLIAEDNLLSQQLTLHVLQQLGYQAHAVDNGQSALDALARQRYDVVLMDVHMPKMGGLEATRAITSRFAGAEGRPRIIGMSADNRPVDMNTCLAAGMDACVPKPVQADEMRRVLALLAQEENGHHDPNGHRPAAPLPVAPPASGLLDDEMIESIRGLDDEEGSFLRELTSDFNTAARSLIEAGRRSASEGDRDGLLKSMHTLKGASQSMGAAAMAKRCQHIEERLHENAAYDAAPDLAALHGLYVQTQLALRSL